MSTTTTTGTLAAGESKTFTLAPGAAVSLTLSPNIRVTITETPESVSGSGVGGNTSRVHEPQLPGTFAYGPYAMGGVVVVAVASNSGSSVAWTRKDTVVTTSADGTSLVSGDGTVLDFRMLPAAASIYNPTITHGTVYDGANPANTYRYNHDPALEFFNGTWYCQWNGNALDEENAAGQYILQSTSTDFVTWTDPVKVFCDAAFSNNPVTDTGSNSQWQPGMMVVGNELWSFWHDSVTPATYISKLTAGGKWTTTNLNIGTVVDDGISYQACFVSANPIRLPSGRIICPTILQSSSTDSTATGNSLFSANYRMCSSIVTDDNGATFRLGGAVTLSGKPWAVWEPVFCVQPDGVLRMYCRSQQFGPAVRYAAPITFTGALSAATSGTLSVGFVGETGAYIITFSDGSARNVTLTNASTAVSWTTAVTATAQANVASQTDRSRNMLTATSVNEGGSWSTLQSTGVNTSISRPGIINGGDRLGIKYLLKEDFEGTVVFARDRRNLSLYAGIGVNDFVPLVPFTDNYIIPGIPESYAQGVQKDGKLYIVNSMAENSFTASTIRTHVVDSLPTAGQIGARGGARCYNTTPYWRAASGSVPAAYVFGGARQKLSAAGSTSGWASNLSSGAVTMTSRKIVQGVVWDNRNSTTSGYMIQIGASYLPTDTKIILRYLAGGTLTDLESGLSAPALGGAYFLAWAIDTTAKTFSVWVITQDGTVTTNTVAIPGTPSAAAGGQAFIGSSLASSTLNALTGDVYRYRVWDILFSTNNVRAVYNTDRGQINGAQWVGTEAFPSGARIVFNNNNADAGTNNASWLTQFSSLGLLSGNITQITDGTVNAIKIAGNASMGWAPCNIDSDQAQYQIRYKTPAGRSNEVGILTIGQADNYIEVTKASASAQTLQIKRQGTLDATASFYTSPSPIPWANDRYYSMKVSFMPGYVQIEHDKGQALKVPFSGSPVVYLGRAHNSLELTSDMAVDYVLYDLDAMAFGIGKVRDQTPAPNSGTWTPVLKFGGATTGIAYASALQAGAWARINDMIFWSLDISLTSKGSATGTATIDGFPFTGLSINGASLAQGGVTVFATGMDTTAGSAPITGTLNATSMTLRIVSAGAVVSLADTHFGASARLRMSGWFIARDPLK